MRGSDMVIEELSGWAVNKCRDTVGNDTNMRMSAFFLYLLFVAQMALLAAVLPRRLGWRSPHMSGRS